MTVYSLTFQCQLDHYMLHQCRSKGRKFTVLVPPILQFFSIELPRLSQTPEEPQQEHQTTNHQFR